MSSAITELQPTQYLFAVRFVQGYRFLDKCGEAVARLERALDEAWIPGELVPTRGQLRNFTLGMAAAFNSQSLNVSQSEFLDYDSFHDQASKIYDVVLPTFEIRHILAPTFGAVYQIGFAELEAAEELLFSLRFCVPDNNLISALGGNEDATQYILCTRDNVNWKGIHTRQRRRFEAKVVRQERQPSFDERIVQRLELLPERYREAMRGLRKLRRQHARILDYAVRFDIENSFEDTELNRGTFDVRSFLTESRHWTVTLEEFIRARQVELKCQNT